MIRKFNYTGRKRIKREVIEISLEKNRGRTFYDTKIKDLDDLGIPLDTALVLEAFDRGSYQRFSYGTVGEPKAPPSEERLLSEVQDPEMVIFRLRAIDQSEKIGKIVGTTANIKVWAPEIDETRKSSLLPVVRRDIGDLIWKMNFNVSEDSVPELIINQRFDKVEVKEMLRTDAYFTSLAYPAALREILYHTIIIDKNRDHQGDTWGCKWIKFAISMPGMEPLLPTNSSEQDFDWIDDVVNQFCRQFAMLDTMIKKGEA